MSLCHGDLGNLELLREASVALDIAEYKHAHDRIAASMVRRFDRTGLQTGLPGRTRSHGLLRGVSGIAFGLLRLAAPETPSVLLLDPPPFMSSTSRMPSS
ncbi:MAG: lanthionine synthetase LanC family protein [Gaiellaceae bacterium]